MKKSNFLPIHAQTRQSFALTALLQHMESMAQSKKTYPPCNYKVNQSGDVTIEMAVAGFTKEEIDVQHDPQFNSLLFTSSKSVKEEDSHYIHKGLATRNFKHKVELHESLIPDYNSLSLENGILTITCRHQIKDEDKPRRIEIT